MRLRHAIIAIFAAGLAAITAAAVLRDDPDRPPGEAPRFGFNELRWATEWQADSDLVLLAAANAARQAGADTARIVVPWFDVIDADGGWDEPGWDRYREANEALTERGMAPVIALLGTPGGTGGGQEDPDWTQPGCSGGLAAPPSPVYDAQWSEFVARASEEFDGALGIQVWNEPNSPDYWGGCPPDPERYLQLVELARRAIAGSPDPGPGRSPAIVSAGLNASGGESVVPWETYLGDLVAGGLAADVVAVGLHPYPSPSDCDRSEPTLPERLAAAVGDQVDRAAELVGAADPIWVTEFGASSAAGLTADCRALSEPEQAGALAAMYAELRDRDGVGTAIVHQLVDDRDSTEELQNHFGVTRELPLLAPKPAYPCLAGLRRDPQGDCSYE